MKINFSQPQGLYVVAVSGGVDSVVLLHLLTTNHPDSNYIVTHVNHGIRDDSINDKELVSDLAINNNLAFEYTNLGLGPSASEAEARSRRYGYLRSIMTKHRARAIVTAHNQDDVIETMFINIIRGTGRRGLAALNNQPEIIRPLLDVPKSDIYQYANSKQLLWHEDSTNKNIAYLRNNIRHNIVKKMSEDQRKYGLEIIARTHEINKLIDKDLGKLLDRGLHKGKPVLSRKWFSILPHDVATEIVYLFLRQNGAKEIDKKTIERVTVAIKTMPAGKTLQLSGLNIELTKRSARIKIT